jgi:hypothetical protein
VKVGCLLLERVTEATMQELNLLYQITDFRRPTKVYYENVVKIGSGAARTRVLRCPYSRFSLIPR